MPAPGGIPRRPAAVALSLVVHGALLAALAARSVVELSIEPSSVLVTLVDAGSRTGGPGERAPELRVAAPLPVGMPQVEQQDVGAADPGYALEEPVPVEPPQPVAAPEAVEPEPAPAQKPPAPAPPAKPATPGRPRAAAVAEVPVVAPGIPGGLGDGPGSVLGQAGGSGAVSTAPVWSAVARVRYEELLFAWMSRHKQYPALAQRRGIEGSGAVRVRIDRDGRVLERSLVRGTGQGVLDQAALEMVARASPFPAVPAEYAGATFEFVAPIEFRLR